MGHEIPLVNSFRQYENIRRDKNIFEGVEMFHKKRFIKDFKRDELIEDVFVVRFKKPIEQYKNGYKFELRVGDSTKEIMFKLWGPSSEELVRKIYDEIRVDDFVLLKARVNEWNNSLELSANELSSVRKIQIEQVDLKDFIAASKRDLDKMYAELESYMETIVDEEIKGFIDMLFSDKDFIVAFKNAPASMYKHHNWVGGLMEHTLNVLSIASDVMKIHSDLDRDFVIAGALIHDIGKVEEFKVTSNIKVGEEGMLLGHITIGLEMISRIIPAIKIDPVKALKLKHILLSHHGELEYGSPKKPAFPEALLVHMADELDARLNSMQMAKDNANTEDAYIYTQDFGNIYLK